MFSQMQNVAFFNMYVKMKSGEQRVALVMRVLVSVAKVCELYQRLLYNLM
jgi:hypothetical protein